MEYDDQILSAELVLSHQEIIDEFYGHCERAVRDEDARWPF
jgi:hypothetical protein